MHRRPAIVLVLALIVSACGSSESVLIGDTARYRTPGAEASPAASEPDPTPTAAAAESTAAASSPVETATPALATNSRTQDPGSPAAEADPTGEAPNEAGQANNSPVAEPNDWGTPIAPGGAVDSLLGLTVEVHDSYLISEEPGSFVARNPTSSDRQWLMTRLAAQSSTYGAFELNAGHLSIVPADGDPIGASQMIASSGQEFARTNTRAGAHRTEFWAAFELAGPRAEVDGWELRIGLRDTLPLDMPLAGPAYRGSYPVELAETPGASFKGRCPDHPLEAIVDRARIRTEMRMRLGLERVEPDQRFVDIELRVTAPPDQPHNNLCELVSAWPDFTLLVDGRPQPTIEVESADVQTGGTRVVSMAFAVPSTATELELQGGREQSVLGTWNVELPAAIGEPGASKVPDPDQPYLAPLNAPWGPRPSTLTTSLLGEVGAIGTMHQVQFEVGATTATNASFDTIFTATPEISSDRSTWLATDLAVQSNTTDRWRLGTSSFVLVDPLGRPTRAAKMVDESAESLVDVTLDSREFHEIKLAFSTDGLVEDLTGWRLEIHRSGQIPMGLEMTGATVTGNDRIELEAGQSGVVTFSRHLCDLAKLEVVVDRADLVAEAIDAGYRAWSGTRLLQLTLGLRFDEPPAGNTLVCDSWVHWPDMILDIDGRPTPEFGQRRLGFPDISSGDPVFYTTLVSVPDDADRIDLRLSGAPLILATWNLGDG